MEERKDFLKAYNELYHYLLDKYHKLNKPNDYFEMDFIWEDTWIPRFISNESAKIFGKAYEKEVVDFALEKLCKMESELLKYEELITTKPQVTMIKKDNSVFRTHNNL
jgi:hypothetical protein